MKKFVLLLICFVSIVFAQTTYYNNESNETNTSEQNQPKVQSIFLSYEEIPLKIYVGELFAVKIKAIIANDDFEKITSSFQDLQNIEIINSDAKWEQFSDNIFYNTFYMKVNSTSAKLPTFNLDIYQNSLKIDSEKLKAKPLNIIKLNGTKYFSKVIAKSMKIKQIKTTKFDDKNLIVVLEIEAEHANLSDFSLEWVIRDGIDSTHNNLPYFEIFYYAIVPNFTKDFIYTYFNSDTNEFEKNSIPIVIEDGTISTQINLNPAQNSFEMYKDGAYIAIILLFITLLIRKRKKRYIFLIFMLIGLYIYDKNPFDNIKIEKGSKIKILPTEKSTIFYVTDRTMHVQKLDSKDNYIKILLPSGKIGWLYVSKN
ncbi:MAG: hypothetical protein JJV95_06620 [Sulfurospirillum sp.]|nr:hypothetical protein [Sulfurospirillum sp.]MBL0703636.1 hypothetical protein [Sulfurospirillum sp.]